MMKIFYSNFFRDEVNILIWMGALTSIIAEFGDQSTQITITSMFLVLRKLMFVVGCFLTVLYILFSFAVSIDI
jgi:hypothetical protein